MLDILAALGPRETIEEVAGPVANALRNMYNADHCAVGTLEGDSIALVAIDSRVLDWQTGNRIAASAVLGDHIPDGPVVHVVKDLSEAGASPYGTSTQARDRGLRSSMRVLVGTPAEPVAVVTVGSVHTDQYTEADARQLAQIVQPLAVAIRYFRGRQEAERRT